MNGKWIWAPNSLDKDDYIETKTVFTSEKEEAVLNISCDTVYAIYLNGNLVKFMQCTDYEYYKLYDSVKLKVNKGENTLIIQVWHVGFNSSTYQYGKQGLIFEVLDGDKVLAASSEETLSRVMNEFKNGYCKLITVQQGISFYYDNTVTKTEYGKSILVDKTMDLHLRDIHDIELQDRYPMTILRMDEEKALIDLGRETAGIPDIEIDSPIDQEVLVAYGEHIIDGKVRRHIGPTDDYSWEYKLKKGENKILSPLKRFGGRYLEIFYKKKPEFKYLGLRPVNYVHEYISRTYDDPLIDKINEVCIRTLDLCMHEHYEDCPWREEALYTLDSRNQMLCGYYVFKGHEYPRFILTLFAKSIQPNGLLPITVPCGIDLAIPSFSLFYIQAVREYLQYTNDYSVLDEIGDTIHTIMKTFQKRMDSTNLIHYFEEPFWNFYEWSSEDSTNGNDITRPEGYKNPVGRYELIINELYCLAVQDYNFIYNKNLDCSKTKQAIMDTFYMKDKGVFKLNTDYETVTQLANALAYSCGLVDDSILDKIINDKEMVPATLSMMGFVYDALLKSGKKEYQSFIIEDIKKKYKYMLDQGATSFWETEKGAGDFGNRGSLCHGWSSIPIYYFNKLL